MNATSRSGLTLIELIVIVVLVLILSQVIYVDPSGAVLHANMTAVGVRGRDLYVAVTAANAEREAVGLPPLWPRDFDPAVNTNGMALAELDFDTSTGYFKWLMDESHLGTEHWNPCVKDIDYSKLAGAGVSACSDRNLKAKNNMWTVAKNVRRDMDDIIPILVTRNIDASSLAARVVAGDQKGKSLRFDPTWEAPLSNRSYVLIRKGGAIFKATRKYLSYANVYQKQTFDTAHASAGRVAPLKYLTPTREVTLNEQTYVEGAAVAYQLAGGRWGKVKRDTIEFMKGVAGLAFFLTIIYLLLFAYNITRRKQLGMQPLTSAPIIGVWICHGFAVTFYAAFLLLPLALVGFEKPWRYGVAALVTQTIGIALTLVFQRHDRETRRRQIKWLLAPLWIVLACLAVFICLMVGPCK